MKQPSTKQVWAQGPTQRYGVELHKVPRAENVSELRAHPVGEWSHEARPAPVGVPHWRR